jgi:hypothetical protein
MRSFITSTLSPDIINNDLVEADERGRACSIHGGEEECM